MPAETRAQTQLLAQHPWSPDSSHVSSTVQAPLSLSSRPNRAKGGLRRKLVSSELLRSRRSGTRRVIERDPPAGQTGRRSGRRSERRSARRSGRLARRVCCGGCPRILPRHDVVGKQRNPLARLRCCGGGRFGEGATRLVERVENHLARGGINQSINPPTTPITDQSTKITDHHTPPWRRGRPRAGPKS